MILLRYLDANCLVKLVIEERDSVELKEHFFQCGGVYATTVFCFYEALSVLKLKWMRKKRPDNISEEEYLAACEELCAMVEDENIQLEKISVSDRDSFNESVRLVSEYKIDLSDAFQLVTLKRGMFARLDAGCPVLISEDEEFVKAARKEGLRACSIRSL